MHLVAPDILAEARGLSVALSGTGVAVGLLLWLLGWRGHRFWIVLAATVTAGVVGLCSGSAYGAQPLVAALLLAVAAGALALALVRVVAFVAGGVAAWMAVHAVLPSWDEPVVTFLSGGLVGLALFRVWTMALTSLSGTLLIAYSSLCLLDRLDKLDAAAWADGHATALDWACLATAAVGLVVQFVLDRRRQRALREKQDAAREAEARKRQAASLAHASRSRRKPALWDWVPLRRAS